MKVEIDADEVYPILRVCYYSEAFIAKHPNRAKYLVEVSEEKLKEWREAVVIFRKAQQEMWALIAEEGHEADDLCQSIDEIGPIE